MFTVIVRHNYRSVSKVLIAAISFLSYYLIYSILLHPQLAASEDLKVPIAPLPPSFQALITLSALPLSPSAPLRYSWRYDDEWESASRATDSKWLLEESPPTPEQKLVSGFPFPRETTVAQDPDTEKSTKKILWNTASHWWGDGVMSADLDFHAYQGRKEIFTANATLLESYPWRLKEKFKGIVLFRELLNFTAPPLLKEYAFLSYRFFGTDPDQLWVRSPLIKKSRQLAGANRADLLFHTLFSLEDIFTWMGSISSIQPVTLTKEKVTLPFASADSIPLVITQRSGARNDSVKCSGLVAQLENGKSTLPLLWSLNSKTMSGIPPWYPQGIVTAERDTFVVELRSSALFHSLGRQVLYIDVESMLPIYKEAYNHEGELVKAVFTLFAQASSSSPAKKRAIPIATIIFEPKALQGFVLRYSSFSVCDELPQGKEPRQLDPRKFGGDVERQNRKQTKAPVKAVEAEIDESAED